MDMNRPAYYNAERLVRSVESDRATVSFLPAVFFSIASYLLGQMHGLFPLDSESKTAGRMPNL